MDPRTFLNGNPPAATVDLAALSAWSPVPLPTEYLAWLRVCDGGDAARSEYPEYLRFWSARTVVEYNGSYEIARWVPGLIGFADDGGSVFLAFDTRAGQPYPVVAVPFAPMEWESAEVIAASFEALAGRLLPRDAQA